MAKMAATPTTHGPLVETIGERPLQETAIEEFLDHRRTDHDHQNEQQRRRTAGPIDEVLSILGEPVLGERVGPQGFERQVDHANQDELRAGADRQSDQVDPPE